MMKKTVIFCLLAAALVSAQPKQRVAVLPSVGDLDPQRLILLTDKVRELAIKNLPKENFNILKQDVITKMIGEEELYWACKDGVCIGDLAKRTNANYGARCDVFRLDTVLMLKFELYSVNEEAIFETFIDDEVTDFFSMLTALETRLPDTFKKMIEAYKSEAPKFVPPMPAPLPPETYTPPPPLILNKETAAAEQETPKPKPDAAAAAKARKKALKLRLRVIAAVAAVGGLAGGLALNEAVKNDYDKYKAANSSEQVKESREDINFNISLRNNLYLLAAVGLSGFAVTLFF